MQSNHPIKITIQAVTGGGKSTIAAIITKALREAGFQNVAYQDEDGEMPASWQGREAERIAAVKDTPIKVGVSTLTYSKVLPEIPTST